MRYMSKYICVYKDQQELQAIIIPAPNQDTAEFFVKFGKMLDPEEDAFDILSITKFNPTEHISLKIH
jgi:hypothetical protein